MDPLIFDKCFSDPSQDPRIEIESAEIELIMNQYAAEIEREALVKAQKEVAKSLLPGMRVLAGVKNPAQRGRLLTAFLCEIFGTSLWGDGSTNTDISSYSGMSPSTLWELRARVRAEIPQLPRRSSGEFKGLFHTDNQNLVQNGSKIIVQERL